MLLKNYICSFHLLKIFLSSAASTQVADELIDAVKKGLGSRLACSLPLPDYSAGEVELFSKMFKYVYMHKHKHIFTKVAALCPCLIIVLER